MKKAIYPLLLVIMAVVFISADMMPVPHLTNKVDAVPVRQDSLRPSSSMKSDSACGPLIFSLNYDTGLYKVTPWTGNICYGLHYDYGEIPRAPEQRAIVRFYATNRSKQVVATSTLHASCGCNYGTLEKDIILPGETIWIEHTYDASRPGQFTKTMTLSYSCDGRDYVDVFNFKGKVIESTGMMKTLNKYYKNFPSMPVDLRRSI